MEYRENGDVIFIRLHQDEDLFESLREICRKCDLGVGIVISGVGMLKQAEISYFVESGRYSPVMFPEPLELVSLSGNIIIKEDDCHIHLHAALARESKETLAGHLSKGKVNVTNEIVILKTTILADRELDAATGLMALTFR